MCYSYAILMLSLSIIFLFFRSLDTRILNDILMDLDRSLLCPDKYFRSKTDLASFHILSEQSSDMLSYLTELQKCYNTAVQLLQEWW